MDIIIKTTPSFDKHSKKLIEEQTLENLYDFLQENPTAGDLIPGSGGIRKLRWVTGKSSRGKSGGVRVLYHYSHDILILLITLYAKSEKENITQKEKNQLKKLLPQLVAKYIEEIRDGK